jgi:adenylosuccinate lyase
VILPKFAALQRKFTMLNPLNAISPVDGRYHGKTKSLAFYFSEFGLIRYRTLVEIKYFAALCQLELAGMKQPEAFQLKALEGIIESFSESDAQKIKDIEKTTNHDVKAVEYFLKTEIDNLDMADWRELIHFGLTSQDINNTAIPLSLKEGLEAVYYPLIEQLIEHLDKLALEWQAIPMLAHTHGQPASPTLLGKEIAVFGTRLKAQLEQVKAVPFSAKFGGATGNMNAHYAAYPDRDWHAFARQFVENELGLSRSYPTTQIEHYDNLAALFHAMSRVNTILIDFCRDIWQYISMEYFKQKVVANEVGSSAMPHKVNPIDFENAEGNLGVANALFGFMAEKLPISRLQRDLTDSTVLRNVGVPIGHSVIAFESILKGLGKLLLNEPKLAQDLEHNWAVVAEAIQNVLRRESYPNPYEALKALTRGKASITAADMSQFIDGLDVSEAIKTELRAFSPSSYVGKFNV